MPPARAVLKGGVGTAGDVLQKTTRATRALVVCPVSYTHLTLPTILLV